MTAMHKKLDSIRANIAAIRQQQKENHKRAHLTEAEVRRRISAWLNNEIRNADPVGSARGFVIANGRIADSFGGFATTVLLLGLEATVDRIVEMLKLDGYWQHEQAISSDERAKRLESLDDKLFHLERNEELEILALEDAGHIIDRRPDLNPDVVIGTWNERE